MVRSVELMRTCNEAHDWVLLHDLVAELDRATHPLAKRLLILFAEDELEPA